MKKIQFLILFGMLLLGCRRDEFVDEVTIDETPPIILVVSSFKGKVTAEDGTPVPGATVRVFKNTTTTDGQGLFTFNNVEAPKGGALISVEKAGFFIGASMAGNGADGKNFVRVTLLDKGIPQMVSGAVGGVLQLPNGLKTTIKPFTLVRANGSVYTGEVSVYSKWLDPTNQDLGGIMPGALMAKNEAGEEMVLATFGMAALELETASGEPLEVKDGETVDLDIPIPPALEPEAPTEIPLWYFDLEEERWLLSGICQKTGGAYYHCSVTNTGYWNCDIALEPICLSGTILQSDSTPAYYTKVIVEDLTNNFIYWGYTDINGFFCGSVPKGAPLRITIEDLCGNVIFTADFGPYAQDIDLGDIYLAVSLQEYFIHVSGILLDCFGAPVALGQVAVQYPGKIRLFPLNSPGFFDFQLALHCIEFPELLITGYDLTNFKASAVQSFTDQIEIQMGVLTACTDPEDYFNLTMGTTTYSAAPTRFSKKDNEPTNWMVLEALTVGGSFTLDLRTYQGVGQYNVNAIFNLKDNPVAPNYLNLNAASPNITVTIAQDDGNFISGTLSGTAFDDLGQPQIIDGNFKVKKEL
ncbi:MAG: carboxypeptidase-like regulatory domain-containing protein [Saprospiraceae bacterium]